MRLTILCAVLLAVSGCYVYQPGTTSQPPVGTPLRVTLTDTGSVELAAQVGPRVTAIDGLLQGGDQTQSLLLSVTQTVTTDGVEHSWTGEQVRVPRTAIATVRERKFSPGRSALAGAVLTGAVVAVVKGLQSALSNASPTPKPPGSGQ